jgi:hypothetical protein
MASVAVPPQPLDPEIVAYNQKVDDLVNDIKNTASSIGGDMKMRQLPDGLKGKKVYGARAGVRSNFNKMQSQYLELAKVTEKLKKGVVKTKKGQFVGFAAPSYIDPAMARLLGLKEGSILWPQGGKPIFSFANITKFMTNRVLANGLVHDAELSRFSCDPQMAQLFQPYLLTSNKPGKEPLDLNNLSYTGIQQLIKNFVEKRSKEHPGPVMTDQLKAVFSKLDEQFATLKEIKEKVKDANKKLARTGQDLLKAKERLDKGEITQELYQGYAIAYKNALEAKNQVFSIFHQHAKAMGM